MKFNVWDWIVVGCSLILLAWALSPVWRALRAASGGVARVGGLPAHVGADPIREPSPVATWVPWAAAAAAALWIAGWGTFVPLKWRVAAGTALALASLAVASWLPWAQAAGARHPADFALYLWCFLPLRLRVRAAGGAGDDVIVSYREAVAEARKARFLRAFAEEGSRRLAACLHAHRPDLFGPEGAAAGTTVTADIEGDAVAFRLAFPGVPLKAVRELWKDLASSGVLAHALGLVAAQAVLEERPGGEALVVRPLGAAASTGDDAAARNVRVRVPEAAEGADPASPLGEGLPPLDLVAGPDAGGLKDRDMKALESLAARALEELELLSKVPLTPVDAVAGPTVLRILARMAARGAAVRQLEAQAANLAGALNAGSVRIAPASPADIPKGVAPGHLVLVEIGLPPALRRPVSLAALAGRPEVRQAKGSLPLALGVAPDGRVVAADLAKAPHLLVAGTTGSGKSMFLHALILQLLLRFPPDRLRLGLVDPKAVELSPYAPAPHALSGVVHGLSEALDLLDGLVEEMESRYQVLQQAGARDLEEFNAMATPGQALPRLVLVVDEFADLLAQGKGEDRARFEKAVQRLAQKARAAGIHLVLTTQRPTKEAIPPIIKANLPARVALRCTSELESRVVLDRQGAELLLGRGDLLFLDASGELHRAQGAFVPPDAVRRVVEWWQGHAPAVPVDTRSGTHAGLNTNRKDLDILWEEVVWWLYQRKEELLASKDIVLRPGMMAVRKETLLRALAACGYVGEDPLPKWAEKGFLLRYDPTGGYTWPVKVGNSTTRMVCFIFPE